MTVSSTRYGHSLTQHKKVQLTADSMRRCHAVDDGRLLQTLVQHKDLVTCIAASSDGRTVVSGASAGGMLPAARHCHASLPVALNI